MVLLSTVEIYPGHFPGKHSILWERFYPLGIGPLNLRDSGHPLGNGTRFPLGIGLLLLW